MAAKPADSIQALGQFWIEADGSLWLNKGGLDGFVLLYTADQIKETNRTLIPILVDGDLSIAWATDIVPGDPLNRTYFERFGNVIQDIKGLMDTGGSTFSSYSPSDYVITFTGADITSVRINNIYIGYISIL